MTHMARCLLVASAAALLSMALASTASATTATGPGGGTTPAVHAVNSGGHVIISNPIANISCSSTFEFPVESHGSGVTAEGLNSSFTFTSCTNSWHTTVISRGGSVIHWTSGGNGTYTLVGFTFDTTRLGVTCVYGTGNTDVGTITGGNPGHIHIVGAFTVHTSESSGLCGSSSAKVEGSYDTTSELKIDP